MGKGSSTRWRCSQGSQDTPGPAASRWRTQAVPASYMVFRFRKGPQVLDGFTLGGWGSSSNPLSQDPQTHQAALCPLSLPPPIHSLPHCEAEEDSGAQEGGEAEQGEEHSAHVGGQPGPARCPAVGHEAGLGKEVTRESLLQSGQARSVP